MITKNYSSTNAPSGYRLVKEGELIRRDDIYYAEVEKISSYNMLSWRKCKIGLGKKFTSKSYMPVARRV